MTAKAIAWRVGQAFLLWGAVGGPILWWWPEALGRPALWAVVAFGVLANVLQPSYRLHATARASVDGGTFLPILLAVYATQAAALVELVLRRPAALPLDAVGATGLLAMVAGLALRTWAIVTLGRWFTLEVGVAPAQRVVEEGPYRVIRHPSYVGALLAFAGSALLLRAWVAAALGTLVLGLAYRRRIVQEERVLLTGLSGYADYVARTGALVPRVRRRGGPETAAPALGRDAAPGGGGRG